MAYDVNTFASEYFRIGMGMVKYGNHDDNYPIIMK